MIQLSICGSTVVISPFCSGVEAQASQGRILGSRPKRVFAFQGSCNAMRGSGNEPGALREVVNWDCMGQTWANPRACRGVTNHRAE